ncbi:MAG TPA: hypothetical protein PLN26_11650 [Acidobacteriota bacterium]|nr:hypothetical protein [Acidobacteriota bacterium]HQF87878.1 hypothetical protein [Acidobacteriota bacterium]HQG93211.1 hypothetical protein [Acidobacteriota bacterium]HQK88234.1 hypothetical protein [Acidobacteriota bacterium]
MKYRVCIDNKNFNVILADIYPDPAAEVDVEIGYHRYRSRILAWSREQGIQSILVDGVPFDIEAIRNESGDLAAVKVDNTLFSVQEIMAGKLLTTRQEVKMVKEGLVRAFMPGLIVRVLKSAGETVAEGDTVLYMEAMKMENAIVAPRAGTISRIGPKEGETVLTGDVLFVVE